MILRECGIRFYEIFRVHHLPLQERVFVLIEPPFKACAYFIPPFDALLMLHERFLSTIQVFHALHVDAAHAVLLEHNATKDFFLVHD
jgi:23S rRNA A2030 N6-methylase RlmJ